MPNFDPPSDPYGSERNCRICDNALEYNPLIRAYECTHSHDPEPEPQSVALIADLRKKINELNKLVEKLKGEKSDLQHDIDYIIEQSVLSIRAMREE